MPSPDGLVFVQELEASRNTNAWKLRNYREPNCFVAEMTHLEK